MIVEILADLVTLRRLLLGNVRVPIFHLLVLGRVLSRGMLNLLLKIISFIASSLMLQVLLVEELLFGLGLRANSVYLAQKRHNLFGE